MKYAILLIVLAMSVMVGCSHMHDTKRIPASAGDKQKEPCGLEGSVDERIADCSTQEGARKESFVLVARSRDLKEVHKDERTGLLWSDRLSERMDHYSAQKVCQELKLSVVAGISGKRWKLPTIEQYQEANRNGIIVALSNMRELFWSSSVHRSGTSHAWVFGGYSGGTYHGNRNNDYDYSARCVAR